MDLNLHLLRLHERLAVPGLEQRPELQHRIDAVLPHLARRLSTPLSARPFGSLTTDTAILSPTRSCCLDLGILMRGDPLRVNAHAMSSRVRETLEIRPWLLEPPLQRSQLDFGQEQAACQIDLQLLLEDRAGRLYRPRPPTARDRLPSGWQPCDPIQFLRLLNDAHPAEDGAQFRRVIRLLKRWKDMHFIPGSSSAPSGHALTLAALHGFMPVRSWQPGSALSGGYNDLLALARVVESMRQTFTSDGRLRLRMPLAPYEDVLAHLLPSEQLELQGRLDQLAGWLQQSRDHGAVEPLVRAFDPRQH